MSEITIEEFRPEHFDQVLNILHQSNCLHAQNDPQQFICTSKDNSIPYLHCILQHPDNFGYVALDGKEVVGLLLAGEKIRDENVYRNNTYWQVYDIVVSCDHKKRGIGKKLINQLTADARMENIKQIELEVFSFNNDAVAFYEKMDFREVSRIMTLKVD